LDYDPLGNDLSTPIGKFQKFPIGTIILGMKTIEETRRQRLELLLKKYGSLAGLNDALGWVRTDSRLSRIKNANSRTDRSDKVFQMGSPMARVIEDALDLPKGWMDTPVSAQDVVGEPDLAEMAYSLLQGMDKNAQQTALKLLVALTQPEASNGTTGKTN
jgi:hypothetical protein